MKYVAAIAAILFASALGLAQGSAFNAQPQPSGNITGLYSFLHEGEFVQIEVNEGVVTGQVSHFRNEDEKRAEFVNQLFDEAKLDGAQLSFRTKPVDGSWYEFSGVVERGPGKTPGDESYWNIRGTLTERKSTEGKATEKTHGLTLKSFPQDANAPPKP